MVVPENSPAYHERLESSVRPSSEQRVTGKITTANLADKNKNFNYHLK